MDFMFQTPRDTDIMVKYDPYKRLYLCVPNDRYGYVCYLKDNITAGDVERDGCCYRKIGRWIPSMFDTMILKSRLERDVSIVSTKQGKRLTVHRKQPVQHPVSPSGHQDSFEVNTDARRQRQRQSQ